MELIIAKRWAIKSLIAEIGLLFLSILFGFWLLIGALVASLIAFGMGIYISVAHKLHCWLLASIAAIGIPACAFWSTISGLSHG